jgi:hypothetical protein
VFGAPEKENCQAVVDITPISWIRDKTIYNLEQTESLVNLAQL